jgi:hypothetical protein
VGIASQGGAADPLVGMFVTTAPTSARGRTGDARLRADLAVLDRLDPDRRSCAERLEDALGRELAEKLVFALARTKAVRRDAVAA